MWPFRILRLSQACVLLIWSSLIQVSVVKLLAEQEQLVTNGFRSLEDLMWNVDYIENLKRSHSTSIYTFFFTTTRTYISKVLVALGHNFC